MWSPHAKVTDLDRRVGQRGEGCLKRQSRQLTSTVDRVQAKGCHAVRQRPGPNSRRQLARLRRQISGAGSPMMSFTHEAWVLFLALFALYSPVAALSSYLPIIRPYSNAQQIRLSVGLFFNAAIFVLVAIWVGEPLLKLLGLSTAAITATGGIALIFAAVPLMRGVGEAVADDSATSGEPEAAPTG